MAPALPAAAVLHVTIVVAVCCRSGRADKLWLLNGCWQLDLFSTCGLQRSGALCSAWHVANDARSHRSTEHLRLCCSMQPAAVGTCNAAMAAVWSETPAQSVKLNVTNELKVDSGH